MTIKIEMIEPSKTGYEHFFFISSYLGALANGTKNSDIQISVSAHASIVKQLREVGFSGVTFHEIKVVPAALRRLVRKSVAEFYQVARLMFARPRDTKILITCMLPPALILLEFLNIFLRHSHISVVLHGEIEHLLDSTPQKFSSIYFWSRLWLKMRPAASRVRLIVLDDFIVDSLLNCTKIAPAVIHHPISVKSSMHDKSRKGVCFVGFNTAKKGFHEFERLSQDVPELTFLAIGEGVVRDLRSGEAYKILDNEHYLRAIGHCRFAVFPYTDGYSFTLSAAALDAVAAGTKILSLRLPFFEHLERTLGTEVIINFDSVDQIKEFLKQDPCQVRYLDTSAMATAVRKSCYSIDSVGESFLEYFHN